MPFSRCAGGVEGLGPVGGGGAHVAEELALRGGLFGPAQDAAAAPVRRPERRLRASRAPRREALFAYCLPLGTGACAKKIRCCGVYGCPSLFRRMLGMVPLATLEHGTCVDDSFYGCSHM